MAKFAKSTYRTIAIAFGAASGVGVITWYKQRTNRPYPFYLADDSDDSLVRGLNKVLAANLQTEDVEPYKKWDHNWDRRDPKAMVKPPKKSGKEEDYQNEVKKATPTAARHIFLIRHGQYDLDGQGDENRKLTKLGQEQAATTGKRLKDLNYDFSVMVNSTMTRAIETADIIADFLPCAKRSSDDLLREGAPYPPEPAVGHWKPEAHFFTEGARIEAAFRKYFHRAAPEQTQDSYEVMVFHANVIRYFICRLLQLPPEAWLRFTLHHGSITWVTIRPSGRVGLRCVGDAGHMPLDLLTFQ